MSETKASGFGHVSGQPKKKKKAPNKREAAASKYDEMKSKGLPEFNIFIRIKGKEWVPAGSMAENAVIKLVRQFFNRKRSY